MKKFTVYSVIMVMLAIAVGTVSSCKDYEEDIWSDVNFQQLTMQQAIQAQMDSIRARIAALEAMKACDCDSVKITNLIKSYLKTDEYKDSYESMLLWFLDNKGPVTNAIDSIIKEHIKGLSVDTDSIRDALIEWFKANKHLFEIRDTVDTIVYDTIVYDTIVSKDTTIVVEYKIEDWTQFVKDLTASQAWKDYLVDILCKCEGLDDILRRLKNLEDTVKTLVTQEQLTEAVRQLQDSIGGVNGRVTELNKLLNEKVAYLKTLIDRDSSNIIALEGKVTYLIERMKADSIRIEAVEKLAAENDANLRHLKDSISEVTNNLQTQLTVISARTDSVVNAIEGINTTIANLETTIESMQGDITALQTRVATLETQVGELQDKVDDLTQRVEDLEDFQDNVQTILADQITGVIIQGVTNPVMLDALYSLPLGVQSNILMAYHGNGMSFNHPWPSALSKKYAEITEEGEDNWFTPAELAGFSGAVTIDNGDGGFTSKAGKIYFTVNPIEIDLKGANNIRIVNSRGEASGLVLKNVVPSTRLMTFGVSRVTSTNGLWEADVEIEDLDACRIRLSKGDLRDVAGEVKTFIKTRKNVKDLAVSTAKAVKPLINMPAYALRVPYTWMDANGNLKDYNYVTNYGVAATWITPLSYNTNLEAITGKVPHKHLPYLPLISKLIEKPWNKVTAKLEFDLRPFNRDGGLINLHVIVNYDEATIDGKPLAEFLNNWDGDGYTSKKVHIPFSYLVPVEWDVENKHANVTKYEWRYSYVDIYLKTLVEGSDKINSYTDLIGLINDTVIETYSADLVKVIREMCGNDAALDLTYLAALSDQLNQALEFWVQGVEADLTMQIGDILSMIENMIGKGDDVIGKINGFIDRINDVLDKIYDKIDNANHYMQPVMLSTSGLVSRSKVWPTVEKVAGSGQNSMVLFPTSYTAEFINPAYKKFVRVVAAKDAQGNNNQAAVDFANGGKNMNKVVEGFTRGVEFRTKADYAGLTYEIVYAAIDYHGVQTAQRYYIKVKK